MDNFLETMNFLSNVFLALKFQCLWYCSCEFERDGPTLLPCISTVAKY